MSRHAPQNATQDRSSKEIYEKLLRIVDYQTGGPGQQLPAMASESVIYLHLMDYDDVSHERADKARRAALENGDLLKWPGPDGRPRYALIEEDALKAISEEQYQAENGDEKLVARCNELRRRFWGGDSE